jgi:hypothetical protein
MRQLLTISGAIAMMAMADQIISLAKKMTACMRAAPDLFRFIWSLSAVIVSCVSNFR